MQIRTPDPARDAAALLMGRAAGDPQMAVVLKAAYDLVADGAGPRRMQPAADPARSAVVMADLGVTRFTARDVVPPILGHVVGPADFSVRPGPPEAQILTVDGQAFTLASITADDTGADVRQLGFDLTYEADTALRKARADIVVTGFAAQEGTVRVDGATWLTRNPALPSDPDADAGRNLFGFQPRLGVPRRGQAGDPAAFAAFHRRGGIFGDAGTGTALPSGGLVEIFRSLDTSGAADYALRLPDLGRVARLRVYCGHGPDTPPRWRKVALGRMRPDTLILHPGSNRAQILWRCHWPADLEPEDRYRSIQIAEEGM